MVIYIPDRTFFNMQGSKRKSNQSLHHHHLSIKIITVPILAYFFHFFSVSIIHVYFNVINLLTGSAFSPFNDSSMFFC